MSDDFHGKLRLNLVVADQIVQSVCKCYTDAAAGSDVLVPSLVTE